jgi:hypothetical protein
MQNKMEGQNAIGNDPIVKQFWVISLGSVHLSCHHLVST